MVGASDKELVDLCLQGNNKAFDVLVDRYQMPMYRVALSIVKNPEEAKDVTQNGFIKSWEKLRSFNPDHKFYSWLYRIITNEALNRVRGRDNLESISSQRSNEGTPFQQMIKKEENRQLYQAIEDLPAEFRSVIYLRHFEELSYKEIAEILDIRESLVKSRLYGARLKLRESLLIGR